jgi:hypothetical protein
MLTYGYEILEEAWQGVMEQPRDWAAHIPKKGLARRDAGELMGMSVENFVLHGLDSSRSVRLLDGNRISQNCTFVFTKKGHCYVTERGSSEPRGDMDAVTEAEKRLALWDIRMAEYDGTRGVRKAVGYERLQKIGFRMKELASTEPQLTETDYSHVLAVPSGVYNRHSRYSRSMLSRFAEEGGLVLPFPEEYLLELEAEIKALKSRAMHEDGTPRLARA